MSIYLISLKARVSEESGGIENPTDRDMRLMKRPAGKHFSVEFDNPSGLNCWKYPYIYLHIAKINGTGMFRSIVDSHNTLTEEHITDEQQVILDQQGAEEALNQTIYLRMLAQRLHTNEFEIRIIPHWVYGHNFGKAIYQGPVRYRPELVKVDNEEELIGMKNGEMPELPILAEIDPVKPTSSKFSDLFKV